MNKITFSHNYFKLGSSNQAKLLAVFKTHYNELGKDFIEFDTKYVDYVVSEDGIDFDTKEGYYPLPHTQLLVLLFQDSDELFTTVRPAKGRYGDKEAYYRKLVGQQFKIVKKEE